MPTVHLFDNFVGPPGSTPGLGDYHGFGVAFYSNQPFDVGGLRYWAINTNATDHPAKIHLWNGETGAEIGNRTVTDHNGLTGWKEFAFGTPFTLDAYTRYVISLEVPNGKHVGYIGSGPTTPDTLFWDSNPTVQSGNDGGAGYPNSPYGNWVLADAVISPSGTPAPSPDFDTGIENAFVRWESDGGDNTRPQGLPVTTKAAVDAIAVDTTAIAADTASIAADTAGLHTKIAADGVTWDAKLGPLQLYGGVTSLGISAGVDIVRTDVAGKASQSSLDAAATEVSAIAASVALALALKRNALVDFPSAPWVMTDETAFDTDVAYTEEADLYVVTFTDLGSNLVNTVVAGVDVSYRLAWWAPLTGAFAQQRRFIDTPSAHLWFDGTRLPGVLLHSPVGAAGTIQAWTYA